MLRCRNCGTPVSSEGPVETAPVGKSEAVSTPQRSDAERRPKKKRGRDHESKGDRRPAAGGASLPEVIAERKDAGGVATAEPAVEPPRPTFTLALKRAVARRLNGRALKGIAAAAVVALLLAAAWKWPRSIPVPADVERVLSTPGESFTTTVFSKNGNHIALGSATGRVMIWSLATGESRSLEDRGEEPILSMAVGGEGFLYVGTVDRLLFGWPNAFAAEADKPQKQGNFPAAMTCIGLRPGQPGLVLGLSNGDLFFFSRKKPVRKETKHGSLRVLAFSPDGETLVTGGADGQLVWRRPDTGDPVGESYAMSTEVGAIAFGPDGTLAAGDWNGQVAMFEPGLRKPARVATQPDAVSGVVALGAGFVTSGWDGGLRFWSHDSESPTKTISAGQPLVGLTIDVPRKRLATPTRDGRVFLWSTSLAP